MCWPKALRTSADVQAALVGAYDLDGSGKFQMGNGSNGYDNQTRDQPA